MPHWLTIRGAGRAGAMRARAARGARGARPTKRSSGTMADDPDWQQSDRRTALLHALGGEAARNALRPEHERRPLAPRPDQEPDLQADLRASLAAKHSTFGSVRRSNASDAEADAIYHVSSKASGWRMLTPEEIRSLAVATEALRSRLSAGGLVDDSIWCPTGAAELGACTALVQCVTTLEEVRDRLVRLTSKPHEKLSEPGRLLAAVRSARDAAREAGLAANRGMLVAPVPSIRPSTTPSTRFRSSKNAPVPPPAPPAPLLSPPVPTGRPAAPPLPPNVSSCDQQKVEPQWRRASRIEARQKLQAIRDLAVHPHDNADRLVIAAVADVARAAQEAAVPLLDRGLQLHGQLPKVKLAASRDIQRRNCRDILKEALEAVDKATEAPLWGDPFVVNPRMTRQARLLVKLIEAETHRRDCELAGELATDVKLASRPLSEIVRVVLAWVLQFHLPNMDSEDLLTSIVGWMAFSPTKAVLSRFLKQGFRWDPSPHNVDSAEAEVTPRSGWGAFDPRKAPTVRSLTPTQSRVHHEPVVVVPTVVTDGDMSGDSDEAVE